MVIEFVHQYSIQIGFGIFHYVNLLSDIKYQDYVYVKWKY